MKDDIKPAISETEGRWKRGSGCGVKVLRKRRSAIREHFTAVFGSRKTLQLGGAIEGKRNEVEQRIDTMRETKGEV